MSAKITLNNAINDLTNTLNNDFVMQNIVTQLVDKINKSKIITKKKNFSIGSYFDPYLAHIKTPIERYGIPSNNYILNLLITTIKYCLSDLNIYDYHLINYLFEYNLQPNNIIVLLILNNIYDIDAFCKLHTLHGDKYHTISTLKKLSALHRIQYNF
jgi:hypothetical protein